MSALKINTNASQAAKAPYIALAKAHEKSTWNTMQKHQDACVVYLGGESPCIICRNVMEEWILASRAIDALLK